MRNWSRASENNRGTFDMSLHAEIPSSIWGKMLRVGVEACKILKTRPHSLLILSRTLCTLKGHIPRRSFLYIPGNDERKVSKATGLNSDCVVLDCEDGVATNRKV